MMNNREQSTQPAQPAQKAVPVQKRSRPKLSKPTDSTLAFVPSPESPFEDGYSIDAERIALADLYDADTPDSRDSRYPRLVELWSREEKLAKARSTYKFRSGADVVVADSEAARVKLLGKMVNEDGGSDFMLLHMRDSVFLFMGRQADVEGKREFIPGAKRAASCLNHLHIKTRDDNPYADWALIQAQLMIRSLNEEIEAEQKRLLEVVEEWRKMGLNLAIMRTATPQRFTISMSSPYGFFLVQQLIRFDELLRVYTTLKHKGMMNDDEMRTKVNMWKAKFRVIYDSPIKFDRVLTDQSLWALNRADYLPSADAASAQRTGRVLALLGEVPLPILRGVEQPFNSRRRLPQTEAERHALFTLTIDAAARNVAEGLKQTRGSAASSGKKAVKSAKGGSSVAAANSGLKQSHSSSQGIVAKDTAVSKIVDGVEGVKGGSGSSADDGGDTGGSDHTLPPPVKVPVQVG
jgi:integrating conjugative element protein (TIGR03761 family)